MAKTGRNEKCPCGSGKKFKKCCLNGGGNSTTPYVSIIDRMTESFKEVHPEWKKFLAEDREDYNPEDFSSTWPDAVNDALTENWADWDDLLLPPTQEAKEQYSVKKQESIRKWEKEAQELVRALH